MSHNLPSSVHTVGRLLWLGSFVYVCVLALAIQFWVLPQGLPQLHGGEGLLRFGDSVYFHEKATLLATQIRESGWSAWRLSPDGPGYAPAGLAAVLYVLIAPHPWVLIPFNAFFHASAAWVLYRLALAFQVPARVACMCALPFVLYPSSLLWSTQIHKDGIYILGSMSFLLGWFCLVRRERSSYRAGPLLALLPPAFLWGAGLGLVWVVRPYGTLMMFGLVPWLLLSAFIALFRRGVPVKRLGALFGCALLLFALLLPLTRGASPGERRASEASASVVKRPSTWQPTPGLPAGVDAQLAALGGVRAHFLKGYPDAHTNMDPDVRFARAADVLRYIPRALQLVFLAPFPSQWFEVGRTEASLWMRRLAGGEMLGAYVAFVGLPVACWRWRRRPELYLFVLYNLGMPLIYALSVPNLGTLYRDRYGFMAAWIALGLAGLWSLRSQRARAEADVVAAA